MDGEIVNVIIAVAVIYFVVKWATGGSGTTGNASTASNLAKTLGFKPKNATPEMIASVRSAFPDVPTENIHYDLLRTGSVEVTVNRLLERGFLDAPPPAYRRAFPPSPTTSTSPTAGTQGSQKTAPSKAPSLIERFNLQSKLSDSPESNETPAWDGVGPIPSAAKGKGRADAPINVTATATATGASVWEQTPEKRQENLKQRKEAMILAARQKFLEKQAADKAKGIL